MLSTFRQLVSDLYEKWADCLMESLEPWQKAYFQSILDNTATKAQLKRSLFKLTSFLAEKFHQRVIVLIDEYEAPNNCAYEHGYFDKVRSLYVFL